MHRFLVAFVCLSTLAMTQNVVAGTPNPFDRRDARAIGAGPAFERRAVLGADERAAVGGEVPSAATLLLLVTGLAGLSAVGSRGRPARKREAIGA